MHAYLFDWDIYNLREEFDELKTKENSKSFSVHKSRKTISQDSYRFQSSSPPLSMSCSMGLLGSISSWLNLNYSSDRGSQAHAYTRSIRAQGSVLCRGSKGLQTGWQPQQSRHYYTLDGRSLVMKSKPLEITG